MYKVIGIDEAGKGPVLGSMFIGCSIISLEKGLDDINSYQEMLKEMGVKDSKKLTPKKRKELYFKLKEVMDIKYGQLTPALIDSNNAKGGKLNELEIDTIVQILESEKPDLVIIDALTSRPDTFAENILRKLSFEPKIISENKADDKYEIVGAASIIAKELREQELEQIKLNVYNILHPQSPKTELDSLLDSPVGSGYPADPKTKKFLQEHFQNKEFDFIFRKSWETYKNLVKKEFNRRLDEF